MKTPALIFIFSLFISCSSNKEIASNTAPVPHTTWNELVQKHVSQDGQVNYGGFIADSLTLNRYLFSLSETYPNSEWTKNEQLAYWINAYNAFTVQLIIRNYPLSSIRDISRGMVFSSPWDIEFITLYNQKMDLDYIEHSVLRKRYNEPRIHFAIVCASKSCPPLRNEAYNPQNLDEQLQDQTHKFINDTTKNKITEDGLQLSKIFSWFKSDFTKEQSLISFIQANSDQVFADNVIISYLEYDWTLNN